MAIPRATDVEYVGTSGSGGVCLGLSATEKVGFFGTTPAVQPTAAVAATTTAATTTSPWGFATSTQADALVTAVNTLIANQTTLGLHG